MSAIIVASTRQDEAIATEINQFIAHYPPLVHDRRTVQVQVHAGEVSVSGNVLSPSTAEYLLHHVQEMSGVKSVETEHLVDDQHLRLNIARMLPPGVMIAMLRQGQVVLTGELPPQTDLTGLLAAISALPGVRQVVNGFGG